MLANQSLPRKTESDTKALILSSVYDLLMQPNAGNFTVESLAAHLGMSKKTIYKYFPSKDRLLVSTILGISQKEKVEYRRIIKAEQNYSRLFIKLLNYILSTHTGAFEQQVIKYDHLDPQIRESLEQLQTDRNHFLLKMLTTAQLQGIIREEIEVRDLSVLITGMSHQLFKQNEIIKHGINIRTRQLLLSILSRGCLTESGLKAITE